MGAFYLWWVCPKIGHTMTKNCATLAQFLMHKNWTDGYPQGYQQLMHNLINIVIHRLSPENGELSTAF
jgi:hypothetical protein